MQLTEIRRVTVVLTGHGWGQVIHIGATHGKQAQQLPQYQRHVQQTGRTTVPSRPYNLLIHPRTVLPTVIHDGLRFMLTCCRVKCWSMSCALSKRQAWAVRVTNSVIIY
jgi:hypothetical protein